jgi:DNA mismatch repair protein MutH
MAEFTSEAQVHNRALEIVGRPLGDISKTVYMTKNKNSVGDIFEAWFGKAKDSESQPDLPEAGVELKATPYKTLRDGKISAKERLVLNIINYNTLAKESFDSSHFLFKNKTIELAFYEYLKTVPRAEWTIDKVALYKMAENSADFEVIKNDWRIIQEYVLEGRAQDLSEGLTRYLAACTKGASAKSVRTQPFSSEFAKQRAFSLKASYMTSLLRQYIFGNEQSESIVKDKIELQEKTLDEIIEEHFAPFVNTKITDLSARFGITTTAKSKYAMLAAAMLGMSGKYSSDKSFDKITEFQKAGYRLKTIVFNYKGKNKESMSLPPFKFKDLVQETWVDDDGVPNAEFHNYLLDTTFIFFVVQSDKEGTPWFRGVKLFNIPEKVIDDDGKFVWEDTKQKALSGIHLDVISQSKGSRVENNLLKKSAKRTFHVRNHSTNSSYRAGSADSDELPTPAVWTGRGGDTVNYADSFISTMSFWINNDYIRDQVSDLLSNES